MDKEIIKDLLRKTKVHFFESENRNDLFTKEHVKYNCEIVNANGSYLFTYQCNPKYVKPTKEGLIGCVLSDARCYQDCLIGEEEDNIQEFATMFGYDNVKELLKAFKGCKEAYTKINKMYSQEEQDLLYEYLSEKGVI